MSPRLPAPPALAPLGKRIDSRRQQVADRPAHLHAVEPEELTPVDATRAEPAIAPILETPPTAAPQAVAGLVDAPAEAAAQPTVGESPVEAQAQPVAALAEPVPVAKTVPVTRSDQSDGGATRITFAVPVRCIEKLRRLARQRNITHADVLVTELARLSQTATGPEEHEVPTVGEYELTAKPVREPLANVGIRLTKKNLDVMDSQCEQLGLPNRSALVAKALS